LREIDGDAEFVEFLREITRYPARECSDQHLQSVDRLRRYFDAPSVEDWVEMLYA
jgi:hypothetical protein